MGHTSKRGSKVCLLPVLLIAFTVSHEIYTQIEFKVWKMDNCTKLIFKNVSHTHTHYSDYSHVTHMKIITGVGVGFCGLVIVGFLMWIIFKTIQCRRNVHRGPVQFGLGFLTD